MRSLLLGALCALAFVFPCRRLLGQTVKISLKDASANEVAFSPDGKLLASAGTELKVWDVKTAKAVANLKGHSKDGALCIAFSPDGETLVSGGFDALIKVWDAKSMREKSTLKGHAEAVSALAFSPDGKILASGSHDKTISLWDAKTGKHLGTIKAHEQWWVNSLAFSPDGKALASAGDHSKKDGIGIIKIWDAKTRKLAKTLQGGLLTGHVGAIESISFSPDGKTLASAVDNTVKLWDVAKGSLKRSFPKHIGSVGAVSFSPDGKTLAWGTLTLVILWDVKADKQKGRLGQLARRGPKYFTSDFVVFSPDGKSLVAGMALNQPKLIKIWDLSSLK